MYNTQLLSRPNPLRKKSTYTMDSGNNISHEIRTVKTFHKEYSINAIFFEIYLEIKADLWYNIFNYDSPKIGIAKKGMIL